MDSASSPLSRARSRALKAWLACCTALLVACGGGGGGGTGRVTPPASSARKANVAITLRWPKAQSSAKKRRPAFISNSTQSITVSLNGAVVATVNSPCAGTCPPTVTTTVSANYGYNTFAASSYDAPNAGGNQLALTVAPVGYTVTGVADTVTLSLNGIVAGVALASDAMFGTAGTAHVAITPLDPDGNVIVDTNKTPYANPLTVTLSDPQNAFSGAATTTISQPGSTGTTTLTFAYDGSEDCAAAVSAVAAAVGTSGGTSQMLSLVNYANPGQYAHGSTTHFGRVRICWEPLTTVPATTSVNVLRGPSPGAESPTPIASLSGAGVRTYEDYTAAANITYYYKVCSVQMPTACAMESSGKAAGDPASLLGPIKPLFWYDANDASTVTQSGGYVAAWADKSGTGGGPLTGIPVAPSGMPYVTGAVNGRNALLSAHSGQYLSAAGPMLGAPLSIFATATNNGSNGNTYARLLNLVAADAAAGFVGTYNGESATFFGDGTTFNDVLPNWSPVVVNASPSVIEVINNGAGMAAVPYTNGTLQGCNGCTQLPSGDHLGTMASGPGFQVGYYPLGPGTDQWWNGYITELLAYPGTLTTANRQLMEGYLACKWGFQASLAPANPYAAPAQCP